MKTRVIARVQKRHSERLAAVDLHLKRKDYSQVLESLIRVFGDPKLPTEMRVMAKASEIEALLGLGRITEAFVAAEHTETIIRRHKLFRLWDVVKEVVNRAREARDA